MRAAVAPVQPLPFAAPRAYARPRTRETRQVAEPEATDGADPRRHQAVLIGHSHSEAIFAAANARGLDVAGYNFWLAPQPAVTEAGLHPHLQSVLRQGPVFSAVGGAVYVMVGLVQHPEPFDFVLPERPDLPFIEGARPLPVAAVEDAMLDQLDHYHRILGFMRAGADGPMRHFEAPPPAADNAMVLADVPWMFFPNLTREVSPPWLRWKLWRLESALTRAFCAQRDIEFVPCPAVAQDEDGFLRSDYYRDATHANDAYGVLVAEQLAALL